MIRNKFLIISIILSTLVGCSTTEKKETSLAPENNEATQQVSVSAATSGDESSKPIIEDKAFSILKKMSDTLSSSEAYSFNGYAIQEQVLQTGQKLQYDTTFSVKMQRPNKLFFNRNSGATKKIFWYSGTQLTLLDPEYNFYATMKTPDNIEDMLDFIMDTYEINIPLSDFAFKDLLFILTNNVNTGFYVAETKINGEKTHHLAFQQEGLDWQIWINAEGPAVPKKFVITYKNLKSSPQFITFFKDWDLSPRFKSNAFDSQIPKDAVKIKFHSKKQPLEESAQ